MSTNYKQTTVSGESWQRCCSVQIDNSYCQTPSLVMIEEKIINVGEDIIRQGMGNISMAFNPDNPDHIALYTLLNKLYVEVCAERDAS